MIIKIISGGQTGADQAGLAAARELGLDTGGYMPRGWLTEDEIVLLNVAGNRESKAPGIFNACKAFLIQALTQVLR